MRFYSLLFIYVLTDIFIEKQGEDGYACSSLPINHVSRPTAQTKQSEVANKHINPNPTWKMNTTNIANDIDWKINATEINKFGAVFVIYQEYL